MGVACLEFCAENFCGWLKNHEIRESFLPTKFPAIRYDVDINITAFTLLRSCYCQEGTEEY